jgi:hypothetical protein
VVHEEPIDHLAHQTRQLGDLIDEKRALWDDEGGRTTLSKYLHPHREAADELLAALRQQDQLLTALEAELAIVEEELEVAALAHRRTEEAVDRALEDVRSAGDDLAEVFTEEAAIADLEARAVRFADLVNRYPGETEFRAALEHREGELAHLQRAYPDLDVRHILEGEVNPKGKFTGCHSHRSVIGMILTREPPDARGVYRASVAGWDNSDHLVEKDVPVHTMFPDSWNEDQICRAVLKAYEPSERPAEPAKVSSSSRVSWWSGLADDGMVIIGHIHNGRIIGYPKQGVS